MDQIDVSPSATVTSNTAPMSTMEGTNIITISGDTLTLPTTMLKGIASTMPWPEGSSLTTSATAMTEPTSTTESLGKDFDHFTTRDQTTGVVPDKNDVLVVNVIADIKLNTVLSATCLAMFTVLAVVVFVHILVYCLHIKGRP